MMHSRALVRASRASFVVTATAAGLVSGCAEAMDLRMLADPAIQVRPIPSAALKTTLDTPQPIRPMPVSGALLAEATQASQTPSVNVAASMPNGMTSARARGAGTMDSTPRPVVSNNAIAFPFGYATPLLQCTVLRACVIELEPGETLADDPIAGDQARWIITRAKTGPEGANGLVVVKPKACDISTNLVLSTDRRIYDLDLDSPPCKSRQTNPKQSFVRHIRFYYPDDEVPADSAARPLASQDSGSPTIGASDTSTLNRDYRLVRGRRGPFGVFGRKAVDFPWVPASINDDGARVYITLPAEARKHAAPVLYVLEDDGTRTMLNFTLRESVVVTDRTFRRGLLVIMNGGREQRLEFVNRSWGRAPATNGR
jgi:type IV secretion system protein VirB9